MLSSVAAKGSPVMRLLGRSRSQGDLQHQGVVAVERADEERADDGERKEHGVDPHPWVAGPDHAGVDAHDDVVRVARMGRAQHRRTVQPLQCGHPAGKDLMARVQQPAAQNQRAIPLRVARDLDGSHRQIELDHSAHTAGVDAARARRDKAAGAGPRPASGPAIVHSLVHKLRFRKAKSNYAILGALSESRQGHGSTRKCATILS